MVGASVRFAPSDVRNSLTSIGNNNTSSLNIATNSSSNNNNNANNRRASITSSLRISSRLLAGSSTRSMSPTNHPAVTGNIRPSLAGANNFGGSGNNNNSNNNNNFTGRTTSMKLKTAIAANDGPSLAAALAQSIRHHSKMIDGGDAAAAAHSKLSATATSGAAAGILGGNVKAVIVEDPYYDEEDQVSLAPTVELTFEKEARMMENNNGGGGVSMALRDYVANGSGGDNNGMNVSGGGGGNSKGGVNGKGGGVGGKSFKLNENGRTTMSEREMALRNSKFNISNWFRGKGNDNNNNNNDFMDNDYDNAQNNNNNNPRSSVRFAQDDNNNNNNATSAIAQAIANGEVTNERSPFYSGNIWDIAGVGGGSSMGRTPTFVAPPATSFRVATRHPSHHASESNVGGGGSNYGRGGNNGGGSMSFGIGRGGGGGGAVRSGPESIIMARKRQRRHDSLVRFMVAILCLGASLTFALLYGEGRFGLAMTTAAYERKIVMGGYAAGKEGGSGGYQPAVYSEGEIFYPEWWEREKGVMPDMELKNVKLLPVLEYNVADVSMPRAPGRVETPFLWLVPRSGANVIRTIMNKCLRLVEASELGAGMDQNVILVQEEEDGTRFVNVDMTTSEGLERANELQLAPSGVPDVVISSVLHDVLEVFNDNNRARAFAVLRHPLDRAVSKYYSDLASDPEVAGMSLTQYVRSGKSRVENNYLTRFLTGQYGGALGVHHMDVARECLRRKFVIGLASDLPGTVRVFDHVFQWSGSNETALELGGAANVHACYDNILSALSDKSPPAVEEGSEGWKLLVAQNWFDMKVYEYAEYLFQQQLDQLDYPPVSVTVE